MGYNDRVDISLAIHADTGQAKKAMYDLERSMTELINHTKTLQLGTNAGKGIHEASAAAYELKRHLEEAYNVDTGKLNLNTFNNSLKKSGMTLDDYRMKLSKLGPLGQETFDNMVQAILHAEVPLKRTNLLLERFATTLKNTARWQISAAMLNTFYGSLQHAYSYAQDLNESLNNIRIVTGYNTDQMAKFAVEANKAAQALSATTTEYTNASLIYYQQGLSDEEVKARTDVTIKMANVAGESAEIISDRMTAVWNNFAKGGENLEYFADVMTALGAATASSTKEISEGLEKFAAIADTVGLSYEYATTALATVTAETRQSADVVGNSFKTIFARLQSLKLGETLEDETTLTKYTQALEVAGVKIKNANGEMKDMDTILNELGARWQQLTKDQQVALANTVAGARQYTNLIALMDNWTEFQENLGVAQGAEGTLQKQADIYAESWEAASKRVKAAAEDIYGKLLDDKFFIKINNGLADAIKFVSRLIDGFGGVRGVVSGLGTLMLSLFGKQLIGVLNNTFSTSKMRMNEWVQTQKAALNVYTSKEGDGTTEEGYISTAQAYKEVEIYLDHILNTNKKLTEEQQKQMQDHLQMLKNSAEVVGQEEKKLQLLKQEQAEYAKRTKVQKEELNNNKEEINNRIKNAKNTIKTGGKGYRGSKERTNNSEYKNQVEALEKAMRNGEDVTDAVEDLYTILGGDELQTAKIGVDNITQAIKELIEAEKELDTIDNKIEHIETKEQEYEDAVTDQEIDVAVLGENVEKVRKDYETLDEEMKKPIDETITFSDVFTNLSQTVMAGSTVFNSLAGMINVINDDSLSDWQKFSTVMSTMALNIPMVISAFKGFTSTLSSIGTITVKGVAALNGMTAAEYQAAAGATSLGQAFMAAFAELLPIIAPIAIGIAAVAAAFIYLKREEEIQKMKLEAAAKSADTLAQAYEDVKNKAADLASSFDQYKEVVNTLNECTKGTEKWKEQLQNVNQEVLDLIDKYPELLEHVSKDKDGQLVIDQNAFENIVKETQEKEIELRSASQLAKIAADKEKVRQSFAFDDYEYIGSTGDGKTEANGDYIRGKKLNEKLLLYEDELRGLDQLSFNKKIEEIFGGEKWYSSAKDNLLKSYDYFNNLSKWELQRSNAIMISGKLNSDKYGQAAVNATENNYDNLIDEIKASVKADSDKLTQAYNGSEKESQDLLKRYAAAIGKEDLEFDKNGVRGAKNGRRRFKFKDIDEEVSLAQMQETIAAYEVLQKMGDKANEAISVINNISNENQKQAINNLLAYKNFENLTEKDLQELKNLSEDDFKKVLDDEKLKTLGYDNFEDFWDKYTDAVNQYSLSEEDLLSKMLPSVKYIFQSLDTSELTLSMKKSVSDILERAFEVGGQKSLDIAKKLFETGPIDKVTEILNSQDWTSTSVESLTKDFKEVGIAINDFIKDDDLPNFIAYMRNGATNFKTLAEKYAEVHKMIDKMQIGDTIDADAYDKLSEDQKAYFTYMADGTYKLTKDAREFYDVTQNKLIKEYELQIDSLLKQQSQRNKIIQEGKLIGNGYLRLNISDSKALQEQAKIQVQGLYERYSGVMTDNEREKFKKLTDAYLANPRVEKNITAITEFLEEIFKADQLKYTKENQKEVGEKTVGLFEMAYTTYGDLEKAIEESQTNGKLKDIADNYGKTFADSLVSQIRTNFFDEAIFEGLDTSKIKELGDTLQYLNLESDKIYDNMTDATSERVAASILRIGKGVSEVKKNWAEWMDEIKTKGEDATEEIIKAQDAVGQLLNSKSDFLKDILTTDFLTANETIIDEASKGIISSIEKLQDAVITEVVKNNNFDFRTQVNLWDIQDQALKAKAGSTFSIQIEKDDMDAFAKDYSTTAMQALLKALNLNKIEYDKYTGIFTAEKGADSRLAGELYAENGKGKQKKDKKYFEDEIDRYWDLNNAITATDNSLKDLNEDLTYYQTLQSHQSGSKLIASLQKENELIEEQNALNKEQIKNYEALYAEQQKELSELINGPIKNGVKVTGLKALGGEVDADGKLTNGSYERILKEALRVYNLAIETYNASDRGDAATEAYNLAEKEYNRKVELLNRYRTLYYNEMVETQNNIDAKNQENLENDLKRLSNSLKAIDVTMKVKLDETSLKRAWNEFEREMIKLREGRFKKTFQDLTINKALLIEDNNLNKKDINATIEALKTLQQVRQDFENGTYVKGSYGQYENTFGDLEDIDDIKQKQEDLIKQLIDQGKTANEIYNDLWENYLEGIDQVKEKLDLIENKYERINEQLEYQKELIELLYGDKAYDLLDKYYKTQANAINSHIKSLKSEMEYLEGQLDQITSENWRNGILPDDLQPDIKNLYDEWLSKQKQLNDLILDGVKLYQEDYLNSINEIFDTMDKGIWGSSFEDLKEDWERIQQLSQEYLDDINGAYKIQTLANKIDQSINDSNNLKYQQRLKEFRDDEIKYLREKENLTQTDIDIAESRYELMLKEIALQDAQENKTSIKLAKDASGNWTYQYVADADQVNSKQQELTDAYNKLYNLANDGYNHSMQLAMDTYETMQEKMRNIAENMSLNEETKMQKIQEIYDTYFPQIDAAVNNSEEYHREAMYASAGEFKNISSYEVDFYNTLTDKQKETVGLLRQSFSDTYEQLRQEIAGDAGLEGSVKKMFEETNRNSQTAAAAVIEEWVTNDGSVVNEFKNALIDIKETIEEYFNNIAGLNSENGNAFTSIEKSLDDISDTLEALPETTKTYCDKSTIYVNTLRESVQGLQGDWQNVVDTIAKANKGTYEYLNVDEGAGTSDNPVEESNPANKNNDKDNSSTIVGNGEEKDWDEKIAEKIAGNIWIWNGWGVDPARKQRILERYGLESGEALYNRVQAIIQDKFRGNWEQWTNPSTWDAYKNYGYLDSFYTGGYTGEWDSSGRLAMLHQKELVLNAADTSNILQAVTSIRDIARLNDSIDSTIAASLGRLALSFAANAGGNFSTNASSNTANQFYITAEFPNADDVDTIREAILSLPNLASQYIGEY